MFVLVNVTTAPVMPLAELFWSRADARLRLSTMVPSLAAGLRVRRAKLTLYDK